jgi:hypothetical protein
MSITNEVITIHKVKPFIVFRYNFSDEIINKIEYFAKIHQYDDRVLFKSNWNIWCIDNASIIEQEIKRINQLGYKDDVKTKMYKSARYYFRKKQSKCISDNKQRKEYTTLDHDIINIIDQHIRRNISQSNYTPAIGYLDFCKINTAIIMVEIKRLIQEKSLSDKEIILKLKKSYKNRYYIISRINYE